MMSELKLIALISRKVIDHEHIERMEQHKMVIEQSGGNCGLWSRLLEGDLHLCIKRRVFFSVALNISRYETPKNNTLANIVLQYFRLFFTQVKIFIKCSIFYFLFLFLGYVMVGTILYPFEYILDQNPCKAGHSDIPFAEAKIH